MHQSLVQGGGGGGRVVLCEAVVLAVAYIPPYILPQNDARFEDSHPEIARGPKQHFGFHIS